MYLFHPPVSWFDKLMENPENAANWCYYERIFGFSIGMASCLGYIQQWFVIFVRKVDLKDKLAANVCHAFGFVSALFEVSKLMV